MEAPHWLQWRAPRGLRLPQLGHFTAATVSGPPLVLVVATGGRGAVAVAVGVAAGGAAGASSSLMFCRNSLMPLPSEPPSSPRRVAPKSMTITRRMMTSSIGPSPNGPPARNMEHLPHPLYTH